MADKDIQHVFIVGSKGIPGSYGGYETFVDKLTEYHQDEKHLSTMSPARRMRMGSSNTTTPDASR
ncbi:MAG: DUF1972 domain-containing protein [Collinsella sp.]